MGERGEAGAGGASLPAQLLVGFTKERARSDGAKAAREPHAA
jgi:hypothetical protein